MGALLEDLRRDALGALLDEEAGARRRVARAAGDEDVVACQAGDDADVAGLDRDVVVELDLVGEGVDAVLAGAEDVGQDALRPLACEDFALGQVLAELADEDAELACGDVDGLREAPLPGPRVAEVAAFRQDLLLDALVAGAGGENRLGGEVLPRLADENRDFAVAGLDSPAIPDPQREGDYGLFVTLSNYTKNAKNFLFCSKI